MGLARVAAVAPLVALALFVPFDVAHAARGEILTVVADRDDDDCNGKADAEEDAPSAAALVDALPLAAKYVGAVLRPAVGGEHVRIVVAGQVVPWGRPVPAGARLQGVSVGVTGLFAIRGADSEALTVRVVGLGLRDGAGIDLELARDHASLERTPPEPAPPLPTAHYDDPDALRVVLRLPDEAEAPTLSVESVSAAGAVVDVLPNVPLTPLPDGRAFATAPLRLVVDEIERTHPVGRGRSLRAEVGGAVVLRLAGRKMQAIRVAGPRASGAGSIGRLRVALRPLVVRVSPGGAPAIGGTDPGAVLAMQKELALASAIWGQCGVTFGPAESLDVHVVDPPPPHLVAFGDDLGLPASGGEVHVRVDGHPVTSLLVKGASPERAARDFAKAVEAAGFVASLSANMRIGPGASPSVDVSVRRRDGRLATVEPASPEHFFLSDATMTVRIGAVDFSDGLSHFGDMDSMAGTLEERTLVKALEDGDPRTVEIVVVPAFAGGGRIGESFIQSDSSSVRNVVLVDRAGMRARRSSFTLAHELGHVFLDMPGHPDDFGIDTPTLLMDSDASDASPFGPRRLTLDDCARVVRESGPRARVPLFTEWPLTPLHYAPVR